MLFDNTGTNISATTIHDAIVELSQELALKEYRTFEAVYILDSGMTYKEEVSVGSTVLIPETFDYNNAKAGYTFVGWRTDTTPSNEIITEKYMSTEPVTLYAVYRKSVVVTYDGNGATGGSSTPGVGYVYYNNGNVVNPKFTIPTVGFTRTNYQARGTWGTSKTGGTTYSAGSVVEFTVNTTIYAQWKLVYQSGTYDYYVDNSSKSGTVTFETAFDTVPNITLNHQFGSFGDTIGKSSVTSKSKTGFSWSVSYGGRSSCTVHWTATV